MKPTKPDSKLALSRQTIRVLTPAHLRAAARALMKVCPMPTTDTEGPDCLICIPELGGTCKLTWRPVLAGAEARWAEQTAREIAAAARAPGALDIYLPPESLTLTAGRAGVALLFDALERRFPGKGHAATARGLIEDAVAGLAAAPTDLSLYTGLAGVA